jgi:hypothetical protein
MTRLYRFACYRWPELVGVVFAGLLVNIWVRNGTKPFLVLLAACVTAVLVLGSVGWLTGTQVVRHARREQQAIQSGNHPMREITR